MKFPLPGNGILSVGSVRIGIDSKRVRRNHDGEHLFANLPQLRPQQGQVRNLAQFLKTQVKNVVLIEGKRRQIVEGAVRVFKKKGYHKATVREIAREADVGLGTIYDYFASKDDILRLFFENYETAFFEKMHRSTTGHEPPGLRLELTYRAVVEAIMEQEDQVLLAYTQAGSVNRNQLKSILRKESKIVGHFQQILQDLGVAPADSLMIANFLVFSAMYGVLRRWNLTGFSREQIIEFLVRTQVRPLLQDRHRLADKEAQAAGLAR